MCIGITWQTVEHLRCESGTYIFTNKKQAHFRIYAYCNTYRLFNYPYLHILPKDT